MSRLDGPIPFRGGGFAPRDRAWTAAATLVGVLVLWQTGASAGVIPTLFLPPPVAIARALWALTVSGELWRHLSASLMRLAVGWIVGTVFGVGMGLAVGLWSALRSPGMALVSALFPIPKIALVPLFIIWFGIGEGSKLATLAFGVFFPTVIATAGGVDNVPRGLIRMGQSFGLSHAAIVRKFVLPAALPAILSGWSVHFWRGGPDRINIGIAGRATRPGTIMVIGEPFPQHLGILPPAQRRVWNEFGGVPDDFVLYGGTALALRPGHRQSIGFDFFRRGRLQPHALTVSLPWLAAATITQQPADTLSVLVDRDGLVKLSFFGVRRGRAGATNVTAIDPVCDGSLFTPRPARYPRRAEDSALSPPGSARPPQRR